MLNDNITSLMLKVEDAQRAPVLNGLGIFTPLIPEVSLQSTTFYWKVVTQSFFFGQTSKRDARSNGSLKLHIPESNTDIEQNEEEVIDTPRVDKGKGRAKPEPEVFEKILSPSFMIAGSDDEDDEEGKVGFVGEPDEAVEGPSSLDL